MIQTLKYLSVSIIISALCAFGGFKYGESKLQKELTEELYYHNALELKQHVAFLKALEDKRYDTSARWHENFMETNLVVLETYGQDSSGKYKKQVVGIVAEAKKYRDVREKEAAEKAASEKEAAEKAAAPAGTAPAPAGGVVPAAAVTTPTSQFGEPQMLVKAEPRS